jgi:AraC family ethanolamine operon transcriptional activator
MKSGACYHQSRLDPYLISAKWNAVHIVLNTRFNNLEQFIDEVQHWDFDFRLLGTGGFLGHVKQFVSRDVLIAYARFQRGLDQTGATPPGYRTFVILGKDCKGFWWRGHQVTNNDLLVFPQSNELQSASNADFEVFTISVREPYLEQLGEDLGLVGLAKSTHEVIRLDSRTAQTLRALAGMIVKSEGGMAAVIAAQGLSERLAICTATGLPRNRPSLRKRDLAVDRVVDYVRNSSVPPYGLAELCRIAGASERTLQYAFKERYGIAPNVYVKRCNLNSVRQFLLRADPEKANVNDIAMGLGFFHQGQFADDYRKLFAELPSTTLDSKQ